jgi:predicted nucleotidyltransferase
MSIPRERVVELQELITSKRDELLDVATRYGARNVRIFGSLARGEATAESDVDILVDLDPGRSLLDLGGLLMEFQAILDRPVDVVTERGLRERIRHRVLAEAVPL